MCGPAALPIVAAGVSAAGTLFQGYGALQQGKYEAAVARNNAKMETEAARESIRVGGVEREKFWRDIGRVKGQQNASMAANGIDLGFGTAARVQDDTQALANKDAGELYRNIEERTKGHVVNASNFVSEAKAAKYRGKTAMIGSVFGAASSLLGGVQQSRAVRAKAG